MSKTLRKILILGAALALLMAFSLTAFAAEFTVTADGARIRTTASTSGEVVSSVRSGAKLAVSAQATDSQGIIWYRVAVDGNTSGYIRSDMGSLSGTIPEPGSEGSGTTPGGSTAIPKQAATIDQSSVRIRNGASTSHDSVASLPRGASIVIIGEATDSSGRKWYEMTATADGGEVTGFVRSDLIVLGDLLEDDEEGGDIAVEDPGDENPEVPVVETPSEPDTSEFDYLVKYEQNEVGGYDYYLYDQNDLQRWKVEEFLHMGAVAAENERLYQEQSARERTIIIVLAIITIILALVVTILLFKIRELYEDNEAAFSPSRPPQSRATSKTGIPIRSQSGMNAGSGGGARPAAGGGPPAGNRPAPGGPPRRPPAGGVPKPPSAKRAPESLESGEYNPAPESGGRPPAENRGAKTRPPRSAESEPETEEPANANKEQRGRAKRSEAAEGKPPGGRKAQNFLAEDDEFEFEFLNIDDK
ncbi:MAG: SH3 domain-containing protein [Lachnospiraceae bacterium]|jgi:hypothetical protein|nr:SH3 domain-containing protein [Lachnospiraceae bacterium]